MAQKKISELTAVVLASGSAVLPIVQDGTTSKITFANLTGSILNVATAVTASHALTALSASYAVSASHEITYELSSSFAETTTSASHALTSNTAISASYALTASHALNANIETGQFAVTGSNTFIGNQIIDGTVTATTFTGSFIGDGSGLTNISGVSGSVLATGSFATTGSNTFAGSQTIGGNVFADNYKGYYSLVGTASSEVITFNVLSVTKTSNHRYFGTGSAIGYHIDGVEAPFLTLLPGKTYRFYQEASNNTHQLRFYYQADKLGPGEYTTNVTHNGTAGQTGAYTQIIITDTTPIVLHYQCVNHAYMGNSAQFSSNVIDTPYLINAKSGITVTGTVTATTFTGSFTGNGAGLTGVTTVSASHALNANTASFAPGIRVTGFIDNSDFGDVKMLGFAGGTVHQQGSLGGLVITILTSSFATTASYAVTASVASDLYKPSGSISVGIGAESNIIQISGSLIQLGNPTLYTQTFVSRQLDISGSLIIHNQLGNGFAGISVDNAGDVQIGANNNLNILLKSDGTTTIYNGLTVSSSLNINGSINTTSAVTASAFLGDASYAASGRWTVGANSNSDYTFTGVGFLSTTNDPILYLARGRVYEFVITSGGSHPFQIRVSNGGSAYNNGVTNNGASSGVIRFEIPFNAPNTLYYQCINHSGMGNTINIYPSI